MVTLPNDTKIRFCNALDALRLHIYNDRCEKCFVYVSFGDGDLCDKSKEVIAMELCYTETSHEIK